MSRPVRAKPITQMRRGRHPARSCGHDRTAVDRPDRPSGRNASPSGITPSTIMSPACSRHGSRTEIRLGARAHTTRTSNRPHAPPSPSSSIRRSRTDSTCDQVPAQIRSVATAPSEVCCPAIRFAGDIQRRDGVHDRDRVGPTQAQLHVFGGRRRNR